MTEEDQPWINNAETIAVKELGHVKYGRTLEMQNLLFKKASESGDVLDKIKIGWITGHLKNRFPIYSSRKSTLPGGIGVQGYARILENNSIPQNDFFTPGCLFEIRAMHSNFPDAYDDTRPGMRLLALKFVDHEVVSPLDLICCTGSINPCFSTDSVSDLAKGLKGGTKAMKEYLLSLPVYLNAHIQGTRVLPDSYYHQHYYAQTVYDFKCRDGAQRLARFRIVPTDGSSESGLMTEEEQKNAWNMQIPDDTPKEKDYLKKEFSETLKKGNVEYTLQIQIHEQPKTRMHALYNASSEWPDEHHPWTDLMKITLTTELPSNITEKTYFNVANHPKDVLGFPEPMTEHDFNVVSLMRSYIYAHIYSTPSSVTMQAKSDLTDYNITLVTGDIKGAGTDADVSISLIGSRGRTSFHLLDHLFVDDFERGSSHVNKIQHQDIGDILCIKIHCKPTGNVRNYWFLSYVTVTSNNINHGQKTLIFPCYWWLTSMLSLITLADGTASLPHSDMHSYLRLQRELEVQDRQRRYQWGSSSIDSGLQNFPGYIAAMEELRDIPRGIQFDEGNSLETELAKATAKQKAFVNVCKTKLLKLVNYIKFKDPIEAQKNILSEVVGSSPTMEHITEHWNTDEEFGRQFVQGVNPVKLTRVDKLPDNFPVTEDMVKGSLETGTTLAEEIEAGKVYLVTYPELEEYTSVFAGQQRFLCAPICLLYVREGKLVPIAIQLTQKPASDHLIFTQNDSNGKYSDWLVAKMWVKVADCQYHQLSTHLLKTHLLMEPIAISLLRHLPAKHPVAKLLISHMRYVMATNNLARKYLLLQDHGLSQTLAIGESKENQLRFIEKMYKKWKISNLNVPKDFEDRGVQDKLLLPGYYYRDDALLLWDAIKEFVASVMKLYYKKDEDVKKDTELTRMIEDLRTNGFHKDTNVPSLNKINELVHCLTSVIFCCSCQHAAVNFGILDHFGFIPNYPPCLMMPPPTARNPRGLDEAGMERLLPPLSICLRTIRLNQVLSQCSDREVFLGDYPDEYFTETASKEAIKSFQANLKTISSSIHERNMNLAVPYVYLLPEKIPNGITI